MLIVGADTPHDGLLAMMVRVLKPDVNAMDVLDDEETTTAKSRALATVMQRRVAAADRDVRAPRLIQVTSSRLQESIAKTISEAVPTSEALYALVKPPTLVVVADTRRVWPVVSSQP